MVAVEAALIMLISLPYVYAVIMVGSLAYFSTKLRYHKEVLDYDPTHDRAHKE